MPDRTPQLNADAPRTERLTAAVEQVIARRISGEDLSDQAALASWPDLLPELADRLQELQQVERARRRAQAEPTSSADATLLHGAPPPGAPAPEALDRLVPGYELLGELHRGGQGVVYRALQRSTGRTVAVKFMRAGPLGDARERLRFEREVQILARLNHPGIVAIHDSGVAAGHHYFVMDLVDGLPLDQFCAQRRPTVAEVVALFARTSDAVSAAHLRGVIHRDLKPSNVLVVGGVEGPRGQGAEGQTRQRVTTMMPSVFSPSAPLPLDPSAPSSPPQPKVLDFGLAKLAADEPDSAAAASMTDTGHFIGSLPWASPEQAAGRVHDIDVRTDVYSLGVMFYQCLTGRMPYEASANLHTMLERILYFDAPRPSGIRHDLDDEIDALALKCLAKEPERRYQSAGELAADLRRYLAGEPLDARRGQRWYLLRKALRRHRVAVGVGAAFVVLVSGAVLALSYLYSEAREQTRVAQQQRTQAQQEAAKAREIQAFLQGMLGSVEPELARGRPVTVREVLDRAAGRVDAEFAAQPAVRAALRQTIGLTYAALGDYPAAEPHLRAALDARRELAGEESEDYASAAHALGGLFSLDGRYADAEALLRQAAELRRRAQPGNGIELSRSLNELGSVLHQTGRSSDAEPVLREALALARQVSPRSADVVGAAQNLAAVLALTGRHDEATELYEEALALASVVSGEDSPGYAAILNNLGRLYTQHGDYTRAEANFVRALERFRQLYGEEHAHTATAMTNLAFALHGRGQLEQARTLHERALALHRKLLGDGHPNVAAALNNLAEVLRDQGRLGDAEPLYREALTILDSTVGPQHPLTAVTLSNLGHVYHARGQYAEAQRRYEQARAIIDETLGPEHPRAARVRGHLAGVRLALGDMAGADALYIEALGVARRSAGDDSELVAALLHEGSTVARERGDAAVAEAFAQEALDRRRRVLGPTHPDTLLSQANLAAALSAAGQTDAADALLREALSAAAAALLASDARMAPMHLALGRNLCLMERYAEAEVELRGALDVISASSGDGNRHAVAALRALAGLYEHWPQPEKLAEVRGRLARVTDAAPAPE